MQTNCQLLKVEEVAERLSVSRSLVYDLIASGRLIAHRIGRGCLRVSESDLLIYLEDCRLEQDRPKRAAPRPRLKHIKLADNSRFHSKA